MPSQALTNSQQSYMFPNPSFDLSNTRSSGLRPRFGSKSPREIECKRAKDQNPTRGKERVRETEREARKAGMVRLATDSAAKKGKKKNSYPSPTTTKKKGRPSKADLARRCLESGGPRRSLRPIRRRRIEEEYDDLESESEGEAAESNKRREKKLKLVLKFPPIDNNKPAFLTGGAHTHKPHSDSSSGLSAAADASSLDEGGEAEDEGKPFKKRRINGRDDDLDVDDDDDHDGDVAAAGDEDDDDDDDDDEDDDDGDHDNIFDDDGDVRSSRSDDQNEGKENEVPKSVDSVPGSSVDYPLAATPLPDKKTLVFILHKLQKKDTYGVYAEPVDPKELPDYHDIIKHPMDFGTVKKKLARGDYSTLEQFQSDVYLICTNAMRYNAPETIYFKQARTIQELARKRFERLWAHARAEMELKAEQKASGNSLPKTVKKSTCRTVQESVGSDLSAGATLAAMGDTSTWSKTTQACGFEKLGNADGLLVDGNSFSAENKHDKAEEFSAKGFPSKFGRKQCVVDENRRATYNLPDQPVARLELVFATFERETKQLVAVGLHADHSYARSLARFAATLGPVAWRVASRRIEQALPAGYKFGRGWVGEYEPLPTPVLLLEKTHIKRQLSHGTNLQRGSQSWRDGETIEKLRTAENISPKSVQLGLGTCTTSSVEAVSSKASNYPKEGIFSAATSEGKPGWFGGVGGTKPVTNNMHPLQRDSVNMDLGAKSDISAAKPVEVSCSSSASSTPINIASQRSEHGSDMMTPRMREMVSRNRNTMCSLPFMQQEAMTLRVNDHSSQSGIPNASVDGGVPAGGALLNGKVTSISDVNRVGTSPLNFVSNHQAGAPSYFGRGSHHEQGLTDPVKLMRMLSGQLPKTAIPSMVDSSQVLLPFTSLRRDESSAAANAARAWMSVGATELRQTDHTTVPELQIAATSLYNPTRELPNAVSQPREDAPGSVGLHSEKNRFASQALQQPMHAVSEEVRFQHSRSTVFPQQRSAADPSRFPVQSPWRGLAPHSQQRQKTEMLPPDLNIGFQSPGSPVQQSPGVRVDSQQPDLALQL